MKKITIFILVLAFIGGFLIFYNLKTVSTPPTQNNSDVSSTVQKWESKVDEQENITVTVTPTDVLYDAKEWKFNVVMNTHSVELNQDMKEVSFLIDESGKEYKSLRWEGSDPEGHHREGILVFKAISPMPSHLELKIKSVGEVERSFKWDME